MTFIWKDFLHANPLPALLGMGDPALAYFARRDLFDEPVQPVEFLRTIPQAELLVRKQQSDGSWCNAGKVYDALANTNYSLLETYRVMRLLVEMYAFPATHRTIQKATDYLFSCQTDEGDIRGILGNQYMPYYHGVILELLVKAGYADDPRVKSGLDWLLAMRQEDGGWIIPAQQVPAKQKTNAFWNAPPIQPDRSRQHSHLATGMVLRAFSSHPAYSKHPAVLTAGVRLMERLFQPDKYLDRKGSAYWFKFQFPFWWTSLLTALDTLSRLGFSRQEPQIARGLAWFVDNQALDGLWETGYGFGKRSAEDRAWVGLAVCQVLKRLYTA